jgi:hypothetical protein
MGRPLTAWETELLAVLASVEARHAEAVRASIPHLVVTGRGDGDDRSFDLRDERSLDDPESDPRPFSRAETPDTTIRYLLTVDARFVPVRVEEIRAPGADTAAPDPDQLVAEPDGLPARWWWAAAVAVVVIGGSVFGWSVYNGYGPDTSGRQTCAVQAAIVERDEIRREWFADRCVDAVRTDGR